MLRHVVNAKERSSGSECCEARGDRPNKRTLNPALNKRTKEGLSRDTNKDWAAKIQ
jgi:hypothetical protein